MKRLTRRTILAAAPAALALRRPAAGPAAGPRRQAIRPRRHRQRDQDRQYRPLQRPGLERQPDSAYRWPPISR